MASFVTIKDYLFESRLFAQRSVQALIFSPQLPPLQIGPQIKSEEHT